MIRRWDDQGSYQKELRDSQPGSKRGMSDWTLKQLLLILYFCSGLRGNTALWQEEPGFILRILES